MKFPTPRILKTLLLMVVLVSISTLVGCGSTIEQVSGSSYSGPDSEASLNDSFVSADFIYTDLDLDGYLDPIPDFDEDRYTDGNSDSDGELTSPPGATLNSGTSHLVTGGTVNLSKLSWNGGYNGPTEVFLEPPVKVTGILVRNTPKDNYLIVSVAHRYGNQADVFQASAISAAQNVTDGTYFMNSVTNAPNGHRAVGRFTSGLDVNPEKTWTYDLEGGAGLFKVSNFELSSTGGSADIVYEFVKMVSPNVISPGILPNDIATGTVNITGRAHIVFGPERKL